MSTTGSHDEFLELCALSTSGELTPDERRRLNLHLAVCPSCRQAKKEYETLAGELIPRMVREEETERTAPDKAHRWSLDQGEVELFRRLSRHNKSNDAKDDTRGQQNHRLEPDISFEIESTWRHVWGLYATAVALVVILGVSAYQMNIHRNSPAHSVSVAANTPISTPDKPLSALEEQLSDVSHALAISQLQITQRNRLISDLRRRLDAQSAEAKQMTAALADLRSAASIKSQQESAAQTESARRAQEAEAEEKAIRARLDSLEAQAVQENSRARSLEAQVGELTRALDEKQGEIDQQRQLLAHDRDIRELMGARDLYMTEVYDVARSGETRKPYGRVFYTKDKSLVFYAYDLDQEANLSNASTFQAWGRRGPDPERALKLGIFYQDNASKKRWVMKCNDPRTLAQIDGVFVTVEPNGSSSRPTSKSFLFAYLKMDPNHP